MGETILDYLFYLIEEYNQVENYRLYFKKSSLNRIGYRLKFFLHIISFEKYISDKAHDIWRFASNYPGVPPEFKEKVEYYLNPDCL